MKTLPPSLKNGKMHLLFLGCLYWITVLVVCWFSFDSVMEFIMRTVPEINLMTYPTV